MEIPAVTEKLPVCSQPSTQTSPIRHKDYAKFGSVSTVYVRELPRKQGKSNERHQSRFAQAVPHRGGRSKPKRAHIATPDALLCERLDCYCVAASLPVAIHRDTTELTANLFDNEGF
jgi:hypothetical protein